MATFPNCQSNDVRVYKDTRNGVIYTLYISNQCEFGFRTS